MGKRKYTKSSKLSKSKSKPKKKVEDDSVSEISGSDAADEDFAHVSQSEDEESEQDLVQSEEEEEVKSKPKKKKKTSGNRRNARNRNNNNNNEYHEYNLGPDEKTPYQWQVTKADPPSDLSAAIKMLPFQREGLAWMVQQENNPKWKGGILAGMDRWCNQSKPISDDMGMGKTLSAISLILSHRYTGMLDHKASDLLTQLGADVEIDTVKTTLVVCPPVAIQQWKLEIEKYTVSNALKVHIYHGQSRITERDLLVDYDIVITSYNTIESDYRYNISHYF